jgi:hypothetical protein
MGLYSESCKDQRISRDRKGHGGGGVMVDFPTYKTQTTGRLVSVVPIVSNWIQLRRGIAGKKMNRKKGSILWGFGGKWTFLYRCDVINGGGGSSGFT